MKPGRKKDFKRPMKSVLNWRSAALTFLKLDRERLGPIKCHRKV